MTFIRGLVHIELKSVGTVLNLVELAHQRDHELPLVLPNQVLNTLRNIL